MVFMTGVERCFEKIFQDRLQEEKEEKEIKVERLKEY